MDSKTYWTNREAEQLKHNITEEAEYNKQLEKIYRRMIVEIEQQINSFYGKYASAEGITIADAKKRAETLDMEAYSEKAAKYVEEKNFSAQANAEMRLYNMTMKVNRLELLKSQIGLELVSGFNEIEQVFDGALNDRAAAEYERLAGILGNSVRNSAKMANAIVNASFHNATFSNRIWMYQDILKNELASLLQTGLIQGQNPRKLAAQLRKRFDVSQYNAERLMRTELARVQIEAQKQALLDGGFKQYTFLALDTACKDCLALDGQHFELENLQPGVNAPPMHPLCRCSISGWENSVSYEDWVNELDNGADISWKNFKNSDTNSSDSGIINSINSQPFAERDIKNQRSASLKRGIRKLEKRISEHEYYLEHPETHCIDWSEKTKLEQEGLKKHWRKEIRNFKRSIQNRINELKERGDYDG